MSRLKVNTGFLDYDGIPRKKGDVCITPIQVTQTVDTKIEIKHNLGREPEEVFPSYLSKQTLWSVEYKDTERVIMTFSATNLNAIIRMV